ncbi:ABC transporter substrate-binding protein [Streptomyces sp. MST-110588]|uniref:ABC transporter substrate-binding protein n=1 Tax=Streptomyces sp. MST-110588 TaxID=2833628 RepID=UPI001F5D5A22|nr:ABC transporter substrate-binding protein [Streptomyces sp. MST-110588]UNO41974.1 ABC transporter substrate-binding protein [Streptomyces sp. MST-110588]
MSTSRRAGRAATAGATALLLSLVAAACTGQSLPAADDDPHADVTLTFWHGWSDPKEIKAIDDNIAAFERQHPNIHVKSVANITDDKINQALRAGGPNAPDVVSSFTTDNVGKFCSSGAFTDLGPFLKKSGIDPAKTFPGPMREYTRFRGVRCALPLLGDAYALYYNKDAFKAAGIDAPPKTWSEFDADAVKLTRRTGDSYERLGFMPNFHAYETTITHYAAQWSPTYFDGHGKSTVGKDSAFRRVLTWQKHLAERLGGFRKLERARTSYGDEFGAKNPFHTGQVAMALDGEWRLGMALDSRPGFEIGVAPLPVPDDQAGTYGKGYMTGTVTGIAATSAKKNAAWELVRFLTTDTDAVVDFANAIHNVPSTFAALSSPRLKTDPRFRTFLDIAKNPHSNTTPASVNGGTYQVTLQDLSYRYEEGREPDLDAALRATAEQIDRDIVQAH